MCLLKPHASFIEPDLRVYLCQPFGYLQVVPQWPMQLLGTLGPTPGNQVGLNKTYTPCPAGSLSEQRQLFRNLLLPEVRLRPCQRCLDRGGGKLFLASDWDNGMAATELTFSWR